MSTQVFTRKLFDDQRQTESSSFDRQYEDEFRTTIGKLSQFGSAMLSGKIPSDVAATLETTVGEKLAGQPGLASSQLGRYLEARDFGMTSLTLSQAGAQLLGQVAGAQQQLWTGRATLDLEREKFAESVKTTNTQLALAQMQLASQVTMQMQDLQFKYSRSSEVGTSAPMQMIEDAQALLRDIIRIL